MSKLLSALIAAAFAATLSLNAVAADKPAANPCAAKKKEKGESSKWAKDHPRRHEVNKRLGNQNKRINQEVKEGEMTQGQARNLHKEDRQIRQEERGMAAQNGGHITKQEQKTLNQQENAVGRQIGK